MRAATSALGAGLCACVTLCMSREVLWSRKGIMGVRRPSETPRPAFRPAPAVRRLFTVVNSANDFFVCDRGRRIICPADEFNQGLFPFSPVGDPCPGLVKQGLYVRVAPGPLQEF